MFRRVLDVAVLLLLGVLVVLPRPDVKVKPVLAADGGVRERVAELQTRLLAAPGDTAASLDLADIFLDARRPDWALAALGGALAASPRDHRLLLRQSLAFADHFEAAPAHRSAADALALCRNGSSAPCGELERGRLELMVATLERVKGLDWRKDPNSARESIMKSLRPAYLPRPPASKATPPKPQQ